MEDIIFIVNTQSGAKQGPKLSSLLSQKHGSRVVDISQSKATTLMERFGNRLSACRVIVCGGDGSVHSVFEQIELLPLASKPLLGVIPLGTGNDIARCLGWGGGYGGEDVVPLCSRLSHADCVALDRWRVVIRTMNHTKDQDQRTSVINNYLSIGFADAKIALDFHEGREKNPALFANRALNKLWYAGYGLKSAVWDKREVQSIDQVVAIEVNGRPVDLSAESLDGVVVLNMVTYAGGMNLWGLPEKESGYVPASLDDGKIEVIGVRSAFHLGKAALGMDTGVRLGQGESVSIFYKANQPPLPCKIDGEPWLQTDPVHIQISRGPSLRVLTGEVPYVSAPVAKMRGRKCGTLSKQASCETHWDVRWFVLTESRLFYFKAETSLCPQGAIVLAECEKVLLEHASDSQNYCFSLCSKNRKLLLQASNVDDMKDWCKALTSLIAQLQSIAGSPSLLPSAPSHLPSTAIDGSPSVMPLNANMHTPSSPPRSLLTSASLAGANHSLSYSFGDLPPAPTADILAGAPRTLVPAQHHQATYSSAPAQIVVQTAGDPEHKRQMSVPSSNSSVAPGRSSHRPATNPQSAMHGSPPPAAAPQYHSPYITSPSTRLAHPNSLYQSAPAVAPYTLSQPPLVHTASMPHILSPTTVAPQPPAFSIPYYTPHVPYGYAQAIPQNVTSPYQPQMLSYPQVPHTYAQHQSYPQAAQMYSTQAPVYYAGQPQAWSIPYGM